MILVKVQSRLLLFILFGSFGYLLYSSRRKYRDWWYEYAGMNFVYQCHSYGCKAYT